MTIPNISCVPMSGSGTISQGFSNVARHIVKQCKGWHSRLQESCTFGSSVSDELKCVFEECQNSDWDGYGAEAVSESTYRLAAKFLEALPLGTLSPSIGAEPDGHLTVEWYRSPRKTVSISVSPEGDLHYAALLGGGEAYGTEPFFAGEVPLQIMALIRRVMQHG